MVLLPMNHTKPLTEAPASASDLKPFPVSDLEPREPTLNLIRPSTAARLLGVSQTTLWRLSKTPGFPKKKQLSPNAVVFREDELRAWIRQLPAVEAL